jgi:hypothetical protein
MHFLKFAAVTVAAAISPLSFTQSTQPHSAISATPKLVVALEPEGAPEFVPLQRRGVPPRENFASPGYNFVVMAVDKDHPPEKPYASATILVTPGRSWRITSEPGEVQVSGTVTVSAPGKARYEAELIVSGREVASAAASVDLGSLR